MLSNAYFLAKIGADTAENEQHFAEMLPIGRRVADRCPGRAVTPRTRARELHSLSRLPAGRLGRCPRQPFRPMGKLAFVFCKICKFLAGSFSAVSKRNFARNYAFDSIFQALQDLHTFAPLQSQNFRKNRFEKAAIFVRF